MLALRVFVPARRSLHLCLSRLADSRYMTRKHEWVNISGDIGTVGITDFATEQLGDVVFVELPATGAEVAQGDAVAAVESVKAASDIYSPVSGTVTERNDVLEGQPGLLNNSPFDQGWLYKMKVSNPSELSSLLTMEAYEEFKKSEEADH